VICRSLQVVPMPAQPICHATVRPAFRCQLGRIITQPWRWRPASQTCAGLPSGTGTASGGVPVTVADAGPGQLPGADGTAEPHSHVLDAQEVHPPSAPHWWPFASRVLVHAATAAFVFSTAGQLMNPNAPVPAPHALEWVSCLSPLVSFFILSSTFIDDGEPEGIVCYMAGFLGCFAVLAQVSWCCAALMYSTSLHVPPVGMLAQLRGCVFGPRRRTRTELCRRPPGLASAPLLLLPWQ